MHIFNSTLFAILFCIQSDMLQAAIYTIVACVKIMKIHIPKCMKITETIKQVYIYIYIYFPIVRMHVMNDETEFEAINRLNH